MVTEITDALLHGKNRSSQESRMVTEITDALLHGKNGKPHGRVVTRKKLSVEP